jgi:hypothetical protein
MYKFAMNLVLQSGGLAAAPARSVSAEAAAEMMHECSSAVAVGKCRMTSRRQMDS